MWGKGCIATKLGGAKVQNFAGQRLKVNLPCGVLDPLTFAPRCFGTFKNLLTIRSAENGMGTCEYLVAPLLLGYKFRRAMFQSEEKPPWRCLLGINGLKTLISPYDISKITPLHWPSKI